MANRLEWKKSPPNESREITADNANFDEQSFVEKRSAASPAFIRVIRG